MKTVLQNIETAKRGLTGEILRGLRVAARRLNVSVNSLIWCLLDVYDDGQVRSHAYADVPDFVRDDGLVVERLGSGLAYTPWQWTEKGREIINKIH